MSHDPRPDVPFIVARDSVELVRDEVERDRVGSIVLAQQLEECPSHPAMAGRIGRERRREVRTAGIAGGCAERGPVGIAHRLGIPVSQSARTRSFAGFAHTADRTPVLVEVLRIPHCGGGVGERDVDEGEKARQLDDIVRAFLSRDRPHDLVVQPRRRAQAG